MVGRSLLYLSAVSLLQLVATAPANSETPTCQIKECAKFRAIRYYEELGCVRNDGSSDCCPTRFDCSSILSLDKTKCHYEGKTYEPGAEITTEIKDVCTSSCYCLRYKGETKFHCDTIDCPLYPYVPSAARAACYDTIELDKCCDTGSSCANDTKSPRNVTECSYLGLTFLEGQQLYGEGDFLECARCVCQQGFDGTLREPWCRRRSCDYTLLWTVSQLGECAPVFRGNNYCCASEFHCPSAADSVVRRNDSATENKGDQCSFGDHMLNIGDEFLSTGRFGCAKCRCDIPPFVTCEQVRDSVCTKKTK